jgi:asparagine synthase (glutamine-hydrolysing)
MCGIFAILNNENDIKCVNNEFMKGRFRGPEFSKLDTSYIKMVLGFHRLAINGLNDESNQPLVINDIVLICNGEIYNYKELYKAMNITPTTGSDCEVIIYLYLKYGIEQTLIMLDGVFSFVLFDNRVISHDLTSKMYIARDPFGIRPLYYLKCISDSLLGPLYGFASELKCLERFYNSQNFPQKYSIQQFQPGTYSIFNLSSKVSSCWRPFKENIAYFVPSFPLYHLITQQNYMDLLIEYYNNISYCLCKAVEKRCLTTERPIACLLSGGLDSSLIAALVSDYYNKNNIAQPLETYSIGLEGSEDLKYARIVAEYIGSTHTEVIVTEQEMFDIIPEVISKIESYDTTTVRASIGNYLLGKYISQNSSAKVIFNGDGSDELFGGYLYMNNCPDDIEFDKETRRLLKDIHLYDVLRSDKSISSNGLEPRTPFLDKSFVNYVLSIPLYFRNHKNVGFTEKFLLRNAFSGSFFENYNGNDILPESILWRKKEAFSDGVSSQTRSLYVILQEHISFLLNTETENNFLPSIDTEKYYYKKIFDSVFPNCDHILPYFWMPKYTDATDPSARTLTTLYNGETVDNNELEYEYEC